MNDFWEFLQAVFWHWQSWLGGSGVGGAVVVFVALYERLSGHSMQNRMYVTIFIVAFLFGAFYMAWRDQYKRAVDAEARIEALSSSGKLVLEGIGFGISKQQLAPKTAIFQARLLLKNVGSAMLRYDVKSCRMTANGREADTNNFSNHGGYAYSETATVFFLPPLSDFDISQSPVNGLIEYELEYHAVPHGLMRKSKKRLSYQFDAKSGDNAYLVLEEDEQ